TEVPFERKGDEFDAEHAGVGGQVRTPCVVPERSRSPAGAACKSLMPRETSRAAPVGCSVWFGPRCLWIACSLSLPRLKRLPIDALDARAVNDGEYIRHAVGLALGAGDPELQVPLVLEVGGKLDLRVLEVGQHQHDLLREIHLRGFVLAPRLPELSEGLFGVEVTEARLVC